VGSLDAVIFDFDGVIANSEPLHFAAFAWTLETEGYALSREDYYSRYLGYDDIGAFDAVAHDAGRPLTPLAVRALVDAKQRHMRTLLHEPAVLFPGAAQFIRSCAAAVPIAIASGALKSEITEILQAADLEAVVSVVVAAGDTPKSKPSPAPYQRAFRLLNEAAGGRLRAERTVAIEDSRWGLESARGAGLRLVGVTNSYGAENLPAAELIVSGLSALTLAMLEEMCNAR
jgi:beta-phosphoglucomutase